EQIYFPSIRFQYSQQHDHQLPHARINALDDGECVWRLRTCNECLRSGGERKVSLLQLWRRDAYYLTTSVYLIRYHIGRGNWQPNGKSDSQAIDDPKRPSCYYA